MGKQVMGMAGRFGFAEVQVDAELRELGLEDQ